MSKYWVLFLTISGGSILTLLLWRSPPDELSNLITNTPSTQINYPVTILRNAKSSEFNDQGILTHTLSGNTIRYFEKNDKKLPDITIEKPVLSIFNDKQESTSPKASIITLSSNQAEANEKEDFLNLIGDVYIVQVNADTIVSQLNTEQLNVQPKRRYAETNKPVIIKDKSGIITATGLTISFDEKRIELLSNVKGKYVPN